jgi:hypothetical protein
MFEAEARWLARRLDEIPAAQLSPVLNIGSSTKAFREIDQPWIDRELFAPLSARGIKIVHLDTRQGDGITIRADVLSDTELPRIQAVRPKALLCCNLLEHVRGPAALARRCLALVEPGGLIFVTVPYSYPHHRDPIDTMFRPAPEALAALFRPAVMMHGEILDVGESYRGRVVRRPWLLFRDLLRLPFPFIGFEGWKRTVAKTYWLVHNYRITGAVFRAPEAPAAPLNAALVDSAEHGP